MRKAGEGMNWRKKITILLISCFVFGSVILLGVSAGGFIRENAWTRNLIFTRDAESKDGLSDEAKEDSVLSAEEAMPLEAGKTEASEYPIVRLYINGERMDADSYLMQHNMVAVQDKKTMLAYGDEAYAMFEKAPANIQVSSPMSYGNLASISYMQAFLKSLLEKNTKGQLRGSEFFVALPTDMQERSFTMLIQTISTLLMTPSLTRGAR